MAYGAQLPVRLEPDVEERLQRIAEKSGTSKSALIRLLAKTFCDHAIQPDGSINLPPNWNALLPQADGRSRAGRPAARESGRANASSTRSSDEAAAARKFSEKYDRERRKP